MYVYHACPDTLVEVGGQPVKFLPMVPSHWPISGTLFKMDGFLWQPVGVSVP